MPSFNDAPTEPLDLFLSLVPGMRDQESQHVTADSLGLAPQALESCDQSEQANLALAIGQLRHIRPPGLASAYPWTVLSASLK